MPAILRRPISARTVIAALLAVIAGCGEPSPGGGPSPTSPTPPGPPPAARVTGLVHETIAGVRHPLGGVRLVVSARYGASVYGTFIQSDADGRYTVTAVEPGALFMAHAFSGAGGGRHQPCVSRAVVAGETVVDVEYNPLGVPGTGGAPTVSGTIFLVAASGREPLPGRSVYYYAENSLSATTVTDASGRYEFCKVPLGSGMVWVVDPNDFDLGGPAATRVVNVSGSLVVDVDVTK